MRGDALRHPRVPGPRPERVPSPEGTLDGSSSCPGIGGAFSTPAPSRDRPRRACRQRLRLLPGGPHPGWARRRPHPGADHRHPHRRLRVRPEAGGATHRGRGTSPCSLAHGAWCSPPHARPGERSGRSFRAAAGGEEPDARNEERHQIVHTHAGPGRGGSVPAGDNRTLVHRGEHRAHHRGHFPGGPHRGSG